MAKLTLYATGDLVNGHEAVHVSAGGPDEDHWRSLGYAPEAQEPISSDSVDASGADAAEVIADWPLKSPPEEYLERYAGEEEVSEVVAERIALARKLVGEGAEG